MSEGAAAHEVIISKVRTAFRDFAALRMVQDPGFLQRRQAAVGWQAGVSRLFGWLPAGGSVSGRRYVFLSGRYAQLISNFDAAEAVLVGNQSDLRLARKLGLPFRFTGNLLAASSAILFGMRLVPCRRIIDSWIAFFSRQADPCYLVVPNDTLPISILLVEIAKSCANVRVVCVQHGVFNAGFLPNDIDGVNSHFNLVYSEGQRAEMLRRVPKARVEVMGFTSEIPPVPSGAVKQAVLIGAGVLDEGLRYWESSLGIFGRVRDVLAPTGMQVDYRPHPSEQPYLPGRVGWPMALQPTSELLAGERKAFIGFCSTMLYEAWLAGHVVLILDDPEVPGYRIERYTRTLRTAELERLPAVLAEMAAEALPSRPDSARVRERFETALARLQAREPDQPPGSGA